VHAVLLTHGRHCPVSDLFGLRSRRLLALSEGTVDVGHAQFSSATHSPGRVPLAAAKTTMGPEPRPEAIRERLELLRLEGTRYGVA
jgi:hypothetical protein